MSSLWDKRSNPGVAVLSAGTLLLAGLFGCTPAPTPIFIPATAVGSQSEKGLAVQNVFTALSEAAEELNLPKERIEAAEVVAYADYLIESALKKGVPADLIRVPVSKLLVAFIRNLEGDSSGALDDYAVIIATFPDSDFAAEALYRQGEIYSNRRQFAYAFDCFSALEDSYPGSPRVDDAVTQAYLVTEMVRGGIRPTKGGRLLWFKDRSRALDFYDRLYQMAPHKPISPRVLYHKGLFAFELSADWFSFDKTLDAIDSFERLISGYPDAKFVPDAYLELAETYEAGVVGADWDQLSTRRAISYYTDFYSLFPENPKAEFAYEKTEELTNLLAANRLSIGDFYYSRHNNLRAAMTFYNEAITIAPDSPAGKSAEDRIARIRRGERAERTWVDWLFGRYPNYDAVDYLDAPSMKPLDQMGFQTGSAATAEKQDAGTLSESEGYQQPGEN